MFRAVAIFSCKFAETQKAFHIRSGSIFMILLPTQFPKPNSNTSLLIARISQMGRKLKMGRTIDTSTHARQHSGLIYLLLILIKTKTRLKLAEMKLRVLLQKLNCFELQPKDATRLKAHTKLRVLVQKLNCFELQPKDATRLKAHTKLRVLVQHLTDCELQTKDQCKNDY